VHGAFKAACDRLKAVAKKSRRGRQCAVSKYDMAEGLKELVAAKRQLLAQVASVGDDPVWYIDGVAAAVEDFGTKFANQGAAWGLLSR
jgi:hypothetical protein